PPPRTARGDPSDRHPGDADLGRARSGVRPRDDRALRRVGAEPARGAHRQSRALRPDRRTRSRERAAAAVSGALMIVRDAERKDLTAVLALMAELAEHEGVRQYLTLTPEALAECVLGEPKRFHVLVA